MAFVDDDISIDISYLPDRDTGPLISGRPTKEIKQLGAIPTAAALLAIAAIVMLQGPAVGLAATRCNGSAKTATMKEAAYRVARKAGGAGSVQGKLVVITGALLNGGPSQYREVERQSSCDRNTCGRRNFSVFDEDQSEKEIKGK